MQKIIDTVKGNEDFQYVLADFALIAVHDIVQPAPMKFKVSTNSSNLFVYMNIPFKRIEELILAKLC